MIIAEIAGSYVNLAGGETLRGGLFFSAASITTI